jgi:nucleotide-binding universal stress UspA family protein
MDASKIRRILVPLDFSTASDAAATMAMDLARRYEAEIVFMHVLQIPNLALPEGYILASPETVATLVAEVAERLAEKRRGAEERQLRAGVETAQGVPWSEIVRFAESNAIDLIVMGTHGRTGISHALIGSVAERVVRRSPCPVLTVRSQEAR